MKNVTKAGPSRFSNSEKALFQRFFAKPASAAVLGALLSSLLLTGCIWRSDNPAVTQVSDTTASTVKVTSETATEPAELPYGVKLQIDPSVLVSCRLERVVDGDTIIVRDPDNKRLRVRLTGINAPESVAEDESRNTEEGRIASKFLKEFLKDTETVYLEYDVGRTDQYDRTLAYVWIKYENTYVMVNEVILASGHAKPVYIKPNLKYADDFRKYEKK